MGRKIWYLNEREDELFGGFSSFDFCELFDLLLFFALLRWCFSSCVETLGFQILLCFCAGFCDPLLLFLDLFLSWSQICLNCERTVRWWWFLEKNHWEPSILVELGLIWWNVCWIRFACGWIDGNWCEFERICVYCDSGKVVRVWRWWTCSSCSWVFESLLRFWSVLSRERNCEVFVMRCWNLNGTAMIGAFYRLPSVASGPIEYCHLYWTL